MNVVVLRRRKLGHTSCMAIKQFSKSGIVVVRNDKLQGLEKPDLLVRWGCTSELDSTNTLNKAKAITLANNKILCRQLFLEKGISTPALYESFTEVVYPCVVRPTNHSQGKEFHYCENLVELYKAIDTIKNKGKDYYISQYIPKQREFGVFVFNDRVTSVIEKMPKDENAKEAHAWNVAQGTHTFENANWSDWNVDVCKVGLQAIKAVGLDFGRVDVIVDEDGKPYVLEVNSAHSLTSEYRQEVFAKCLDYYIENGKVKNELDFGNISSYKGLIHPVLRVNQKGYNL